jgi:hypothetical protein
MNPEITDPKANLKLIESIVQLIQSLSTAEQSILEQKLYTHIQKSPQPVNPTEATREPQPILAFFEEVHRQGPFRTSEQIDHDLQLERDSWDS